MEETNDGAWRAAQDGPRCLAGEPGWVLYRVCVASEGLQRSMSARLCVVYRVSSV